MATTRCPSPPRWESWQRPGFTQPSRAHPLWWPGSLRSFSPVTSRIICWCWSPVAAGLEINTLLKSRHWCFHDIAPGSPQTWAILIALFAFFHSSCVAALGVCILILTAKIVSFSWDLRRQGPLCRYTILFPFLAALTPNTLHFNLFCFLIKSSIQTFYSTGRGHPFCHFTPRLSLHMFITRHPNTLLT